MATQEQITRMRELMLEDLRERLKMLYPGATIYTDEMMRGVLDSILAEEQKLGG